MSSFAALRKEAGLFCGSLLRKGEVFAYVGLIQILKDLKCPACVRVRALLLLWTQAELAAEVQGMLVTRGLNAYLDRLWCQLLRLSACLLCSRSPREAPPWIARGGERGWGG